MSNLLDTILNIEVLAFIGLLLWLNFKDFDANGGDERQGK